MRVAIVYDRANKWGGAERVLLALHQLFPDAVLYTSLYSPLKADWVKIFPKIIPSFVNKLPYIRDKHEYLSILMPIIFEQFDFKKYDLVISVTSEAAKGIITKGKTRHICYCLTPTRYLWSHYETYFKNPSFKVITKPVVLYLRRWDKMAAQRPDVMVAISIEVQNRIKKYYGRDATVIHPPLSLEVSGVSKVPRVSGGYFLVVSRLVPYKKVDLAVEVFNELEMPLYIVGTGSQENKLKKMAKSNIKFLSRLTDRKLASYYRNARALIMPQEEDFGLVAVESIALGTPVIAYRAGGALDIIKEEINGTFFEKQTKDDLKNAIARFNKLKFNDRLIKQSAERFSQKNFEKEFLKVVRNLTR